MSISAGTCRGRGGPCISASLPPIPSTTPGLNRSSSRHPGPAGCVYEIAAAAMHVILKRGPSGAASPPIVGSGPNTCILHYEKNERRVEDGELVLMDFGGLLDYMCMDISRTWPASGKFTKEQREVYEIALEIQKACIEAYHPGATNENIQKHRAG